MVRSPLMTGEELMHINRRALIAVPAGPHLESETDRMKEEMQALVEALLATPDTPEFRREHHGKSPREVTETQWRLLTQRSRRLTSLASPAEPVSAKVPARRPSW